MKEWFLCTTWITGVKRLDVVKETPLSIRLKDGTRINLRYNQSQFVGNTREEAKAKMIGKFQADLDIELKRVRNLEQRIEEIKSW